jgi:hypothetical protein
MKDKTRADNPSMVLLVKLGSLIVHYQEYTSGNGHQFDKTVIDALEADQQVVEWMKQMNDLALLPKKR